MGSGWGNGRRAGATVGVSALIMACTLLALETVAGGTDVAYIAEQALFSALLLVAAAMSALLSVRQSDWEGRIWFIVASACIASFISQAYWTWYVAVNSTAPEPLSVSNVFDLLAIGLFVGLLLSLVPVPQAKSSLWRFAADIAGIFYVNVVLLYVYVITPWYASVAGATRWGSILASVYPVLGLWVLVGTVTRLLGPRLGMWSKWERIIAWGVLFLATGMALWPVQHLAGVSGRTGFSTVMVDFAWGVGMFLVYTAVMYRLDSNERWAVRPIRGTGRDWLPTSRFAMPIVYAAVTMLLGYTALTGGGSSASSDVVGSLAAGAAMFFAVRMLLAAMEARELLALAHRDTLTGVGDQNAFDNALEEECGAAERYSTAVSIALVDVDRLQHYTEIHGRVEAAEVLRAVAAVAGDVCGLGGAVFRLGSGRFGIILSGMHSQEALGVVNAIRAEYALRAPGSAPTTLSAGIACLPDDARSAAEVVDLAEIALWWAKANGRDRVIVHDERMPSGERFVASASRGRRQSKECLSTIAVSVDNRYEGTREHSRRVSNIARILGTELGLTREQLQDLEQAALMHDVGMVVVPDATLLHPGPLSERQWQSIREHPVLGEQIVASAELGRAARIVRSHHERWDGKGYPDRLSEQDVLLESRILAVCEAFDAMLSERPYRGPLSVVAALQQIDLGISTQFDPMVAETFIRLVSQDEVLGRHGDALNDLLRP